MSAQVDARALLWEAREGLLGDRTWLDYVRQVYAIDPGDYPFLTYVGLNFTANRIKNYKFYFSFFRRLEAPEIEALLPVPDRSRFDDLYARWTPSYQYDTIHRGTTFALKVDPDGTLTHYYHLRLPGFFLGKPERLTLTPEDEGNLHGACEEYTAGKVHLKRYFYARDRGTIAASLEEAGFTDFMDQLPSIAWLEYIESEGRDKAAWITDSPVLLDDLIERAGPPGLASGLARIARECGFLVYGPGSARGGGDHSIYFVDPGGPVGGAGFLFDGVTTFLQRHLRVKL
ncbi:MAG: hypothetical protein H6730_37825 [Deltaproteobacteria bacterium]|nr:hypothetical protein [Deltaproteobacteria bacterium]